jgi:hypothetical protein
MRQFGNGAEEEAYRDEESAKPIAASRRYRTALRY